MKGSYAKVIWSFFFSRGLSSILGALCLASQWGALLHGTCSLDNITHQLLEHLADVHAPGDIILRDYAAHFSLEKYEVVTSPALGCYLVEHTSEDMIKRIIREGWHREGHVARFFGLARPGSIVLDIGAHIGTHINVLSDCVGPEGRVYGFEPQLKMFTELMANMILNNRTNVVLHRLAIGNKNELVYMNPPCSTNEGGVSVGSGGDSVQMVRIDDLHLDNVSLMKIDVEGLEMEVLQGARDTINRNRPVMLIEIMGHIGYASAAPEPKKIIDDHIQTIQGMGYEVSHLGIADFLCIPKALDGK